MNNPMTLKGNPVRIYEHDGRFTIQTLANRVVGISYGWFSNKYFYNEQWGPVNHVGDPTGSYSGTRGMIWVNGDPIESLDSKESAIEKIKSLEKGVIIHEL